MKVRIDPDRKKKKVLNYTTVRQRGESYICDLPQSRITDDEVRNKVLRYLRNADFCKFAAIGAAFEVDAFTNLPINATGCVFCDNSWLWTDNLSHYVRNYDVQLPEEFITDVLEFYQHGNEVKQIIDLVPFLDECTPPEAYRFAVEHDIELDPKKRKKIMNGVHCI